MNRLRKGYTAVEIMIVVTILSVLLLTVFLISIHRAKELRKKASNAVEMRQQNHVMLNEVTLGEELEKYRLWMNTKLYQRNMDPGPQDVVLYRVSQGIRYDSSNTDESNKIALSLVRAAILKIRSGKLKSAKQLLIQASQLDPLEPRIYVELGRVGLLGEDFIFAMQQVKTVIEIEPEYADAYILKARVLMKQGNLQEAFKNLKIAAEKVQSSAELFLALSEFHFQKGDLYLSKDYAKKFNALQ
ncbi:MAG: prepilin-type N-terminal cleavage/methylation domain-containing protein [bacterium]|nr:prepilin-type N-terminal cleavage/methylation domain-containing protein [bacterium]